KQAHFLIVPSRAEAYGIVFCEASSFGIPSLTTNVGGIPTVVRDGLNGRTFPLDAPIDEYVAFIMRHMADRAAYRQLAMTTFGEFSSRLNWRSAGEAILSHLEQAMSGRNSKPSQTSGPC
ncbi:MAG: glycosyltransferase, partial [Verrucomicrobiota bacterium]